ncbi:platelet-derived growth factor subunit B-like isoform X2 [Zootermopsis nevadensis]|uniref:platelet-derived growth factor subunit B-like isoform X2 n=1 Tax=Zootermopsis nevadensis TaxID=136037 RepID=UPI000B8EC369|nr:platelet-derived growth factor subunit B-like isoform X2 [Zootermopsis nevadensis]
MSSGFVASGLLISEIQLIIRTAYLTLQRQSAKKIPLDLIQCLNSVENVTDLDKCISKDTVPDDDNPESGVGNRFGDDEGVDRKAAIIPKSATCAPELVTVTLQNLDDKSVVYYPSCTRVERCGGCCSHDLLSCQPTATELLTFQVIETRYEGGTKLRYKGKKYVTVEQHTKCKCDCKVKEEHCNKLQQYEKSECSCTCVNVDEEQKCIAENDTKLWNPQECLCGCRYTKECSTGFYFDQKTCNCSPVPIVRRRISNSESAAHNRWEENSHLSYEVIPRSVVPMNKVAEKDDGK